MKKVVTKSGESDETVVYLYDGQKIIETRDGSGNLARQFIHGTRYIDELVMIRVKDKGDLYVHQDANWNVIGLTDLGGGLVERYVYTPYGELTVYQGTGYGDYDGDGDVDSTDRAAGESGGACRGSGPTGACRALNLDFDNDVDDADLTLFDSLPQGLSRHPGRLATNVSQPFAHQGLLFEPEIGSYQNRARQYDPAKQRYLQRDPLSVQIDPAPGHPEDLNAYRSLGSNPLLYNDPRGLWWWMCERRWIEPWKDFDFWLPQLFGATGRLTTLSPGECDDSFLGGSIRTEDYGYWTGIETISWKWTNCQDGCKCVHRYFAYKANIMVQRGTIVAQTTVDCNTSESGKCCEVQWDLEEREWHVYKVREGVERFSIYTQEQCCGFRQSDCD